MSGIETVGTENDARHEDDENSGNRSAWEVLSWIAVVLTIVLNLVLVAVIAFRRTFNSVANKVILTIGVADFIYGILVSPFFVENYVHRDWNQSQGFCKFFVYLFTFHDFFVPILLILLSAYISVKFSGELENFGVKRPVYIACFILALLIPLLLSIPAAHNAADFVDKMKGVQCRTTDDYTMILSFLVASSVLFCFAMSFLFSLCIVGSPFLRNTLDMEEYLQRWRLLLTISLVNGLYIVTGFLLNFKEIFRIFDSCCGVKEPFNSIDTVTYDVWSFVLLISEPVFRPLTILCFYWKFLLNDYKDLQY